METNNLNNDSKLIDVEKVFETKNPSLFKIIPSFIFRYLKRIIHQEEINEFLARENHLKGAEFAQSILTNLFGASYEVSGLENIPEKVVIYLPATIHWGDLTELHFW